ncbi:DUF6199 family natural product biosynthesis protein [Mycobacteroides abscessus]|uniref:DUF6199 domain-containing protein n=5 Tax=Mycobacteroides abscessus TaxID=36809 RepID=A0A0U0YHE3_9MYCO|nr:DUF6199 family natural product biosynthesis protein [Mycobacteroides abscessus]EUA74015.1 hypothetical protein I540_0159 [Mycobacteroides abscessus subsp. bolletii 1513]AGM26951.1 hypothetical protein MASS_0349 [Mycobacteroides abscessus subsp. bolletii 50594]AMU29440.1 hypothetical protein A3N97_01605 [Mycobacteroides abscessus]AMU64146.1 hypothetical protein A3O04_01655 [Mycobacteroides abscessus]AMU73600.1 hypothetical protein A3O06_02105 [Mycobacteroides abscessus]
MGGLLLFLGLIVVPFLLWSIFDPKSQWQVLSSWKYRNPEANEPSEAAYAMTRIGGAVGLVVLVVLGYKMVQADRKYRELMPPASSASITSPLDSRACGSCRFPAGYRHDPHTRSVSTPTPRPR